MLTKSGLLKSGNLMKCWKWGRRDLLMNNHPYFHRVNGQIYCWWRWYGLQHRRRIRHVVKIHIIPAQGEWSIAKDIGPILKRCNTRQQQTFFNVENVYVFDIASICIHGKELPRKFTFHQNTGNNLTMKQMFDISEKLTQSEEIYGVNAIYWVVFLFWWWRSHLCFAYEGLRIFRFCVMPWKDEREPTIKNCLGRQVDVVQESSEIQGFGHTWRRAKGIRVEYFPRIHHIAALQQSPKVAVKNEWKARKFYRTDHFHVDVERHLMRISGRNANEASTSFVFVREDFHQEDGHSSVLDQKRSCILLMTTNHKMNGTESKNWWW